MTETRKLRVFLCHSSQDKPIVRELYQRLLAEGWIDPWLDEEKILPGQDWDLEIEKAVRITDAVIIFLSTNSVDKEGYIQHEIRLVLRVAGYKPENTIFIIPIRLNECLIPMRFELQHHVDFFPLERKEWAYSRLFESLKVRAEECNRKEKEERERHDAEERARLLAEELVHKEKDRKDAEERARVQVAIEHTRKDREERTKKETEELARKEKDRKDAEERTRLQIIEKEISRLQADESARKITSENLRKEKEGQPRKKEENEKRGLDINPSSDKFSQMTDIPIECAHLGGNGLSELELLIRYMYYRSGEIRSNVDPEMAIGQDYLRWYYNSNNESFDFVICDGVGQSFSGNIASEFLGQKLLKWLQEDGLSLVKMVKKNRQGGFEEIITGKIRSWQDEANRQVQDKQLPHSLPPMVLTALEDSRRNNGSETVFVCGHLSLDDKMTTYLVLFWMGDVRFRLFDRDGNEVITEAKWTKAERWSSKYG